MTLTIASLAIFSLSALGLLVLFVRRIPDVSHMSGEKVSELLLNSQSLSRECAHAAAHIVRVTWVTYVRPFTLLFAVKVISRIRIQILRIEQQLFKIAGRIRQRSLPAPRPSAYWQDLGGWQKTTAAASWPATTVRARRRRKRGDIVLASLEE